MAFVVQDLDLILVPSGLLILFAYHLYLIYRFFRHPETTVIGYDNHIWMTWVKIMTQGDLTHVSTALTVLSTNSNGSTYLATMCLTLCSFIGIWVGSSTTNAVKSMFILGDTSSATDSLKDISMLFAFILSFGAFVQSTRYYVQTNSLICMPNKDVPVTVVQRSVIMANGFWEAGLRFLYFAMSLLCWSFGPIPMFASCLIMVIFLYFLDYNSKPLHMFQPVAKFPVEKAVEEVAPPVKAAEHRDFKVGALMTSTIGLASAF